MYVETLHPGVSRDTVKEAMGWDLQFAADLGGTPLPHDDEIRLMGEELDPKGIYL